MHCTRVSDHLSYHTRCISRLWVEFWLLTWREICVLTSIATKNAWKNARVLFITIEYIEGALRNSLLTWFNDRALNLCVSRTNQLKFDTIRFSFLVLFFFGVFFPTGHWAELWLFSICVPLDGKNYAEKLCEKLAKCHVRINENINKAINQAQSNRKWKMKIK